MAQTVLVFAFVCVCEFVRVCVGKLMHALVLMKLCYSMCYFLSRTLSLILWHIHIFASYLFLPLTPSPPSPSPRSLIHAHMSFKGAPIKASIYLIHASVPL